MESWSKRRRFIYAAIFLVLIGAGIGIPSYLFFYKAPTCYDGKKNGNELGIDCGGSCEKLCPSAFLTPGVSWTRFEEVAPHTYNVAAYIVNPNPTVHAVATPFRVTLYDAQAIPVAIANGVVTIPAGRNTLAFAGAVSTGLQTAVRASFQFTGIPDWSYDTRLPLSVAVIDQKYTEGSSTSALQLTLANQGSAQVDNVTVFAILEDKDKNAIDFSKTVIDSIPPQKTALAPFTWPISHHGQAVSIEVLPVAE